MSQKTCLSQLLFSLLDLHLKTFPRNQHGLNENNQYKDIQENYYSHVFFYKYLSQFKD